MRAAPTIVLIGAGSTSFGLTTLHDLYADLVFEGRDRLARGSRRGRTRADASASRPHSRPRPDVGITLRLATDRTEALPGADAVVVPVEVDRDRRWQLDFEYAPAQCRARARRERRSGRHRAHAPHDPARRRDRRDVERLAPAALFVNFTNPEGRICTRSGGISISRLWALHEVELPRRRFSGLLGRPIECRAAGLNHLTALVTARDAISGNDVTAELHAAVGGLDNGDGETYDFVRYLHDRFGVVIATSDSHAGE